MSDTNQCGHDKYESLDMMRDRIRIKDSDRRKLWENPFFPDLS